MAMDMAPAFEDALSIVLARAARLLEAAAAGALVAAAGDEVLGHGGLRRVIERFGLDAIERDVLLLLLAVEVEPRIAAGFTRVDPFTGTRPSVAAVVAAMAAAGASAPAVRAALAPGGCLIGHALVALCGEGPFPSRGLRVPEAVWPRVVQHAAAPPFPIVPAVGGALDRIALTEATRAEADAVVAAAATLGAARAFVVVAGRDPGATEPLALALAGALGCAAVVVEAAIVEDDRNLAALRREAIWLDAALVVRGAPSPIAAARLAFAVAAPIIAIAAAAPAADACAAPGRWRADIEVRPLAPPERLAAWRRHLDGAALAPPIDLAVIANRFAFGPGRIAASAAVARQRARVHGRDVTADDLRAACRMGAAATSALVHRLDGGCLDDVVVSASTRRELALALVWARHAGTAFRGPAAGRPLRGRDGLVCLFHGPPGTGKTLAAQAIAGELGLDLLRVDLSQVVSKYIGETEKHLETVFAEAESAGAILFFDEAEALFGKRSEVRDAHDRYANIETAFLLQRLELHAGVCILASNLRQNFDDAFSRRLHVIAEFAMPGPAERLQIWERHLVQAALDPDVALGAIAERFAIAGGEIRNAAATGLLLAADEGAPPAMRHLIVGIWREIRKSGRLMTSDDFGPWRGIVMAYTRG